MENRQLNINFTIIILRKSSFTKTAKKKQNKKTKTKTQQQQQVSSLCYVCSKAETRHLIGWSVDVCFCSLFAKYYYVTNQLELCVRA